MNVQGQTEDDTFSFSSLEASSDGRDSNHGTESSVASARTVRGSIRASLDQVREALLIGFM